MRTVIGVELLRKLPAGPVDIRDTKLPGFVLRVRPSGTHTYFATYIPPGVRPTKDRPRVIPRWQPLGTTDVLTAPEARAQARDVLAGVVKGDDPVATRQAARTAMLFKTFVTEHYEPWATAQRKSGVEQTATLRRRFGDVLDDVPLNEIGAFHFERWRSARLKAGIAPATVNRNLNTLRGALSRAVEWGLLSVHPLARVKPSKTDQRANVRYLSADEGARLGAALTARDETRRAERARANVWRRERHYQPWPEYGVFTDHLTPIVRLALHTGLRRGELFQLRWRDVDVTAGRLIVRGDGAKSGQTRHVPLNATALATVRSWAASFEARAPTDVVFAGEDGAPLTDIKKGWAAVTKRAALTDFRFHDCRHDFASKLVMQGVDLNTVRELLGHADIKMVLRYAHLAPEHTAAAVAKLVR